MGSCFCLSYIPTKNISLALIIVTILDFELSSLAEKSVEPYNHLLIQKALLRVCVKGDFTTIPFCATVGQKRQSTDRNPHLSSVSAFALNLAIGLKASCDFLRNEKLKYEEQSLRR